MKRRSSEPGSSTIEGALASLVFFTLIMGIMDLGRLVWTYSLIAHGAREATRYASVHGSESGSVATAAQISAMVSSRSPGLDPANVRAEVTFQPDQAPGSTARVSVTYRFYPIAPYVPIGPLRLSSTAESVIY